MTQTQWDSKKGEILLVEDNPGDARLIELALAEAPPRVGVCVVQDGKEALDFLYGRGKHAGASLPDLIFLDLNLPRIDGRQVLAQVKKDNHLHSIPIIVLSTSSSIADIKSSYSLGANSYVVKPRELDEMFRSIRVCCEYWLSVVTLAHPDATNNYGPI